MFSLQGQHPGQHPDARPAPHAAPLSRARRRRPTAVRGSRRTHSVGRLYGDAPGCCGAIRTRSAAGLLTNRSGGSRTSASPSTPTGTGCVEVISTSAADHCWELLPPSWDGAQTAIPSSPPSRRGREPDPTTVQSGRGCSRPGSRPPLVRGAVGAAPAQFARRVSGLGAEDIRASCRASSAASRLDSPRAGRPRRRVRARRC